MGALNKLYCCGHQKATKEHTYLPCLLVLAAVLPALRGCRGGREDERAGHRHTSRGCICLCSSVAGSSVDSWNLTAALTASTPPMLVLSPARVLRAMGHPQLCMSAAMPSAAVCELHLLDVRLSPPRLPQQAALRAGPDLPLPHCLNCLDRCLWLSTSRMHALFGCMWCKNVLYTAVYSVGLYLAYLSWSRVELAGSCDLSCAGRMWGFET